MNRYVCVVEPGDTWAVWDNETGEPIVLDGEIFAGISRIRAETVRDILLGIGSPGPHSRPRARTQRNAAETTTSRLSRSPREP